VLENLLRIFADNLLPIFLATGVGYISGAVLGVESRSLAKLGFNVFGPCLVFQLVTTAELSDGDIARMAAFTAATLVATGGLAWLLGRIAGLTRSRLAALVLVAMLPNAGNYGLSLVRMSAGTDALAHAGIFFVTSAIVLYTLGVLVASLGQADASTALRGLFRVPAIYAVVLALVVVRLDVQPPLPIERTVSVLAEAAIPVFLVVLGLQLHAAESLTFSPTLAAGVCARLVISPLIAFFLAIGLGLSGPAREAGMIEAAMPTAVATTVLAETYDLEPGFITGAVLLSTMASPLTLTPLLAWLGLGA
jgi:predicted permease